MGSKTKNITRKKKDKKEKKEKILTIPQLRKAFETIEKETKQIKSIEEFQKLWKSVFHRSIDSKVAESYLAMVKSSKSNKKINTRKHKEQKGGVAPIDNMLRPGIDSSSYGNYLPYVSAGLGFSNNINNIAMDADCGKQNISPVISADMGSNKVTYGGSLSEFLSQRPITASVPASPLQNFQDTMLGKKLDASPIPLETTYKAR